MSHWNDTNVFYIPHIVNVAVWASWMGLNMYVTIFWACRFDTSNTIYSSLDWVCPPFGWQQHQFWQHSQTISGHCFHARSVLKKVEWNNILFAVMGPVVACFGQLGNSPIRADSLVIWEQNWAELQIFGPLNGCTWQQTACRYFKKWTSGIVDIEMRVYFTGKICLLWISKCVY